MGRVVSQEFLDGLVNQVIQVRMEQLEQVDFQGIAESQDSHEQTEQ